MVGPVTLPVDHLAEIERAKQLYLHSRCTTSLSRVTWHQAELRYMIAQDCDDEYALKMKRFIVKAELNQYRSLCYEAGITPFNVTED